MQTDVCSLDGLDYNVPGKLVIAVHPWYEASPGDAGAMERWYEFRSGAEKYQELLHKIIKKHSGPIITFEGESALKDTAEYFVKNGSRKNRYFIKTYDNDPVPVNSDFKDIIKFIKNFGIREIEAIGGRFYSGIEYGGCLGHVYYKILHSGLPISINEAVTFR